MTKITKFAILTLNFLVFQQAFCQIKTQNIFIKFVLQKGSSISLSYYNSIDYREAFEFNRLDSNTTLSREINSKTPVIMYSEIGQGTPYVILPGDSLLVISKDNLVTIKSLANPKRNSELAFFEKLNDSETNLSLDLFFNGITKNLFKTANSYSKELNESIKDAYQAQVAFLNAYCSSNLMSNPIKQAIENIIKYNYINNLLLPVYNKRFINNISYKGYTDFIDSFKQQFLDTSILYDFYFRHALYNYNKYLCYSKLSEPRDALFKYLYNSAILNFNEHQKNYILYDLMKRVVYKEKDIFFDYFERFKDECSNEAFKQEVTNIYDTESGLVKNLLSSESKIITTSKTQLDLFKNVLIRDSLLYIDLWASWCAPCLQEMPYSQKLQEKYKEKNIKFVYLSMDNLASDWLRKLKDFSFMNFNNSFLLLDNFTSTLSKNYKITSIPRYILFSKSGKLISSNAPRPSDQNLKTLIDKYLKE